MFQVLVKTAPYMLGSYSYDLGDRASAEEFAQRPDVWWYCFALDDGTPWRKGGAWAQDGHAADAAGAQPPEPLPPKPPPPLPVPAWALPYATPEKPAELSGTTEDADDDDESRW